MPIDPNTLSLGAAAAGGKPADVAKAAEALEETAEGLTGKAGAEPKTPMGKAVKSGKGAAGKLAAKFPLLGKLFGPGAFAALIGLEAYWSLQEAQERTGELAEGANPPSAELMMDALGRAQSPDAALVNFQQNEPEAAENMKWELSGEERPRLTSSEIMFGRVPTNQNVSPEEMKAALASML